MGKLKVISSTKLVKILESLGWRISRQKGSHIIMTKQGTNITLSIPNHKEVAKGTLRTLLRAANITIDEYNQYT